MSMEREDNYLLILVLAALISIVLWMATVGWIHLAIWIFTDL
jgi:hypothetical protein